MGNAVVLPDNPATFSSAKDSETQGLRTKAKEKAKKLLHIESSDEDVSSYEAAMEELHNSPAFNSSKFLNRARMGQTGATDKAIAFLQGAAAAIINPKSAIKARATRKTAHSLARSHPYLSRKADLEFLEAYEALIEAKDAISDNDDDDGDDEPKDDRKDQIDHCAEHMLELERKRHSMQVAWVTTRHVQRVRVVDINPPPSFPDKSIFEKIDDCGFPEFQWGKWVAYKLLLGSHNFTAQYIDDFEELPFDFDTLRRHVERLIIVSAPIQEFIFDVRSIYRWNDPARTGKWMVLYFFLWYISHIMTFWYAYIIYSTVMNYYCPRSVDDFRKEMSRSLDRGASAFKIGELMDKHGSDDWLGPLLDELGPYIQVQVSDLASFLEASYNFYHFRSPHATVASLCLLGSFLLLSLFGDARFALKVLWFIVGIVFFACWPISSLYPRYRLLVSPFKWALWDVPTHAEWCFQYLQERAAVAKQAIVDHDSHESSYVRTGEDTPSDSHELELDGVSVESFVTAPAHPEREERDILSFGCTYLHTPGRFIISTHGIRFTSSLGHILPYGSFRKSYSDLVEMSKRQTRSSILSPIAKVTAGMDKLELRFRGKGGGAGIHTMGEEDCAEVILLENIRERDKAFNNVIGFSGLRWQHLQKRPSTKKPYKNTVAE